MRHWSRVAAVLLAAGLLVPALSLLGAHGVSAANATVTASGGTCSGNLGWSPSSVTIQTGNTVHFVNCSASGSPGNHTFQNVSCTPNPGCSWPSACNATTVPLPVDCTFTAAGSYKYQCGIHGASMPGTVAVQGAPPPPPASPTPRPVPTRPAPPASPSPHPTVAPPSPAASPSAAPRATLAASATPSARAATPTPRTSPSELALASSPEPSAAAGAGPPPAIVGTSGRGITILDWVAGAVILVLVGGAALLFIRRRVARGPKRRPRRGEGG